VKRRFLADRAALDALVDRGPAGAFSAMGALIDLLDLAIREIPGLVHHSATLASPIAGEVQEAYGELRRRAWSALATVPGSIFSWTFSKLAGEFAGLIEVFERIVVRQLALVHRSEVPDYFAGLDREAIFPSFRYSAANRGRVPAFAERGAGSTEGAPAEGAGLEIVKRREEKAKEAGAGGVGAKGAEAKGAVAGGAGAEGAGPVGAGAKGAGPVGAGRRMWSAGIGGMIWPTAVIDSGGDLYLGHGDGEFVALHPDGSVKWRIHDPRMMYIDSTGAIGKDGYLYMASTDLHPRGHQNQGRIWKIDPATGEVLWTFWGRHFEDPEENPEAHLSSFFEGNCTINDEDQKLYLYAGSDDNFLYKLSSDGELIWEYDTKSYPSGVIWTKPLIGPEGRTVWIGTLSGQVHAVATAEGSRRWMRQLGGAVVSSPALGRFGELFLGCFDGKIYALAPEDGTIFWSYQTLGLIYSSPAVTDEGSVIIASSDGSVYCLDRFGRRLWAYYTDAPVKSSPVIDPEGRIYVGNENGKLYCLDPVGRRVWSYHTNPGMVENDINSSPSLGPDGTVYFGSTTGEMFAIPRDSYRTRGEDEGICTDPGHDGKKPDIPPGGGTIVYMDRYGTPVFDPPRHLPITDNLNMVLFAVDDEVNVVPAEIDPESVAVEITPDLPCMLRVESMGRFFYIVPDGFMEYETEYTVRVTCRYRAEGRTRKLDSSVAVRTAARKEPCGLSLVTRGDSVSALVLTGLALTQPKEIDALGQAMLDTQKFALAPIYADEEQGILAMAGCAVVSSGGTYEYAPKTVNKWVVAGRLKDRYFKVQGAMRLIAQGANIPLEWFRLTGRLADGPGIEEGSLLCIAPTRGMPDFDELIRVMRLADSRDDVVGLCTFKTVPFESPAREKPRNFTVRLEADSGRVVARFDTPDLRTADHWVQMVLLDTREGRLITGGRTESETDDRGGLTSMSRTIPETAERDRIAAILVVDLYPAATILL
jgi:outer membrane protein assembly factor BamB